MWTLLLLASCASDPSKDTGDDASPPTDTYTPDSEDTSETGEDSAPPPPDTQDTGDTAVDDTQTTEVTCPDYVADVPVDLLASGGFEDGSYAPDAVPDSWEVWGGGAVVWQQDPAAAFDGDHYVTLGGSGLVVLYQRVPVTVGHTYTISAHLRSDAGDADADLKIEFHNAVDAKVGEVVRSVTAPSAWRSFDLATVAPPDATQVTASLVGYEGSPTHFDGVTLASLGEVSSEPPFVFDLTTSSHAITGFGAQIWGYDSNPEALDYLFGELGLTLVRIENYWETATWDQMAATKAITDAHGAEWIAMVWAAPGAYTNGASMLQDPEGFAAWWAGHVAEYDDRGLRPAYVELMNEPDSGGEWSTGMTPDSYDALMAAARLALDDAGFADVGIVGPGAAALDWGHGNRDLVLGLSGDGVGAHAGWSTHTWDDGSTCFGGASCLIEAWPDFLDAATSRDPSLPVFVTEYASKETTFHGVTWPAADTSGLFNVTHASSYAVRVYENTLAHLMAGAHAPVLWQGMDEPTEVHEKDKGWGLLDLDGRPKPVFEALRTLLPQLPPGTLVVEPADLVGHSLVAATFVDGERVILAIANDGADDRTATVQLHGLEAMEVLGAQAYELAEAGDPGLEIPDVGQVVERPVDLTLVDVCAWSLEAEIPADSTLTVVLSGG